MSPPNGAASHSEPAGWVSLFDGRSLAQWRGYCRSSVPESWVPEDGALHLKPPSTDPPSSIARADLVTRSEYETFELALDWKVSEGGNSGIFYLAQENCGAGDRAEAPIYESAPEMQILDNERHPDAKLGLNGNRQAGSLYDLIPANPQNARPAGEWNHVELKVDHGRVSLRQNDQTVVEYEPGAPDFQARVAASKFKGSRGFTEPTRRGHIGLQDHGNEVWFRDIRIRER
ncbi:MAG: DUF1080 domain-containing protein [Deltaproteobacteria bacterium]